MTDTLTQSGMLLTALLTACAGGWLIHCVKQADDAQDVAKQAARQQVLVLVTMGMCGVLVLHRWWGAHTVDWRPIDSHADGLLLIATLLSWVVWSILRRGRGANLAAFLLFVIAGLCLWALCPANWRPFRTLEPVWLALHLFGVIGGTAAAGVAASGGAMYLVSARRLKHKQRVQNRQRLSLETLEKVIVRGATAGFFVLTLGMVSGAVILTKEPGVLGDPYYTNPKLWLAVLTWLGYAILMNARFTPQLRGAYAAWVSIVGFVLLLTIYGVFTVPAGKATPTDAADTAPAKTLQPLPEHQPATEPSSKDSVSIKTTSGGLYALAAFKSVAGMTNQAAHVASGGDACAS